MCIISSFNLEGGTKDTKYNLHVDWFIIVCLKSSGKCFIDLLLLIVHSITCGNSLLNAKFYSIEH